MKLNFKALFVVLFTATLFSNCSKFQCETETIQCDTAILCIRNNTNNYYPYGRGGNQITDTLLPGECAIYTYPNLEIEYTCQQVVSSNSPTVYFNTFNGIYYYEINECYAEVTVPSTGASDLGCSNGVFNPENGELDTDCGGYCLPCEDPEFTCDVDENKFLFGTAELTTNNSYVSSSNLGGFEGTVTLSNNNELHLEFNVDEFPSLTRKFITGDDTEELMMYYLTFGATYNIAPNQEVYLLKSGDKYQLKFCDIEARDSYNTVLISGTLNLFMR